jgi:hypothetical protein
VSLLWLTPAAWIGIGLVAVPVLIHLLARRHSRRVVFPSLRFLAAMPSSALSRRTVTDWPLLIVRVLIVTAAVAALASPVVVSSARRAEWDSRVARAVVLTDDAVDVKRLADEAARDSFVSASFLESTLPDAIRRAADWLVVQPPASRELVIIGDIREGAITARDLDMLAPQVGIRFVPAARDEAAQRMSARSVSDDGAGQTAAFDVEVTPNPAGTLVRYLPAPGGSPRVRVIASAPEQPLADALLRAVLRDGVVFEAETDRAVTFRFGTPPARDDVPMSPPDSGWMRAVLEKHPDVRGGQSGNTLVVWTAVPLSDTRAASLLASVVRSSFEPDFDRGEPRRTGAATLARWSRASGGSPADAKPADEGDRRWVWGLALLLLGLEHAVRRRRRDA